MAQDADQLAATPMLEQAARAGRSNLLMAPVLMLAGFATTIVVARVLSADGFALFAAALAFRGLTGYLGDLGAGTASNRLFAQLHTHGAGEQAWRAFRWLALLRLPLVAALVLGLLLFQDQIADAIGLRDSESFLLPYFAVIGAAEAMGSLGYYALNGTFNHRVANRVTVASTLVQPIAIVIAVAADAGLQGIVASVALGSVVKSVGFLVTGARALRRIGSHGDDVPDVLATYTRVANSAVIGKLAGIIHQRQALTFVGLTAFSRSQVAGFALAYDFAVQVLSSLSSPIYSLLLSGLTAVKDDRERTERAFRLVTRLLALVIGPAAAATAAAFPILVPVLFGDGYDDAISFGLLFVPAFGLELVLAGPALAVMLADERLAPHYRRIKIYTIAAAVLYVPMLSWSLYAVAVTMMAIRLVSAIAQHRSIWRHAGIWAGGAWLRSWLVVVAATACCGAALTSVLPENVFGLAAALAAPLLVGAVVARLTGAVLASDLDVLARALPKPARLLERLLVPRRSATSG